VFLKSFQRRPIIKEYFKTGIDIGNHLKHRGIKGTGHINIAEYRNIRPVFYSGPMAAFTILCYGEFACSSIRRFQVSVFTIPPGIYNEIVREGI
jgi:hypothetical protein